MADLDLMKPPANTSTGGAASVPRWIPPPGGMLKVNVDAAISKNEGTVAVSAVARDGDGGFLGASSVILNGLSDPAILEAAACREGLALASDLNLQCVRVVSDCGNGIRCITKGDLLGPYGQVVPKIIVDPLQRINAKTT